MASPATDSVAARAVIEPDVPAPAGVRALVTTRVGGVSTAPWDSWNLGDHVGDDPSHVAHNRLRLQAHTGVRPVYLRQVHGRRVQALDADTPDGKEADAAWTDAPGVACTVLVADCLPVLLATADGRSVAAAHAGWRGLAGAGQPDGLGVIEALFTHWPAASGPARTGIWAWLGPAIGAEAFEVGEEVRDAFCVTDRSAARHFHAVPGVPGKHRCNLAGLARDRLQALGVRHIHGHDGGQAWCTVSQASRFFSHRRDGARLGSSGRLAACIWRL